MLLTWIWKEWTDQKDSRTLVTTEWNFKGNQMLRPWESETDGWTRGPKILKFPFSWGIW